MAKVNNAIEESVGGLPLVGAVGLNTNKNVSVGGTANVDLSASSGTFLTPSGAVTIGPGAVTVSGAATLSSTAAITGAITPTGGVAAAGGFSNSTVFHTGGYAALATTGANQKQIVTTESYFAEVFIPANTTLTGVSLLLGHTTAAQNVFVGLANSSGTIVANSNTTTAMGTADTFQQIPFTSTYAAVGPAKYFIVVQSSQTTGFIATHAALGNFGAGKVTGETYGTFLTTASYKATTFTANLGPIADTY